jgi:N-acetylmuramoyl-L-alanine amidase
LIGVIIARNIIIHWTARRWLANKPRMNLPAILLQFAVMAALICLPVTDGHAAIPSLRGGLSNTLSHAPHLGAARPKTATASPTAKRVKIGPPKPWVELPKIDGPRNKSLPLVVVDAGHGGHDPGAISPHNGRREKDITLSLAQAVRQELLATGRVRVALTRSDDRYLALEQRSGMARALQADLFISIHADAAASPDARGASIYTLSEVASDQAAERLAARENKADILNGVDLGGLEGDVSSILLDLAQRQTMAEASAFARLLQREAEDELVFRTRAHRFAAFAVLKAPDTPSVLFETGYISNAEDARFLASDSGQQKIARGVREAVNIHFAKRRIDRR